MSLETLNLASELDWGRANSWTRTFVYAMANDFPTIFQCMKPDRIMLATTHARAIIGSFNLIIQFQKEKLE